MLFASSWSWLRRSKCPPPKPDATVLYAKVIANSRRTLKALLMSHIRELKTYLDLDPIIDYNHDEEPTEATFIHGELNAADDEAKLPDLLFESEDMSRLLRALVNYQFYLKQRVKQHRASLAERRLIPVIEIDPWKSGSLSPGLPEQAMILSCKIEATDLDSPMLAVYYTSLHNVLVYLLDAVREI